MVAREAREEEARREEAASDEARKLVTRLAMRRLGSIYTGDRSPQGFVTPSVHTGDRQGER